MLLRLLLVFLLISLPEQSHAGENDWCIPAKATEIEIFPKSNDIEYDFTKNKSELSSLDIDTLSPYAENIKTEIGGLMKGGIKIRHGYKYGVRTNTITNQVCMWYDKIKVDIIINPKILIAKEYKQGTCKHQAVMTHEMKHIMKDREISSIYSKKIRDALYEHVSKRPYIGPVDEDKMAQLDIYMKSSIKTVIGKIKQEMIEQRKHEQMLIDNIKEYNAVSDACDYNYAQK